ncbi:MAG TPA: MFS transporter [Steroidobacteraceae bacterium]|nr:MFS transporter [Steroidobacteraceae bacterium]
MWLSRSQRKVVLASSLGTVFEWYDFYLYGSLASIIAKQYFSSLDPTSGFIFALLAFAAGFIVRPFGALVFGRLGDLVGRKHTFLVTIVIMGASTFLVGVLPGYATLGVLAPILLIGLRLLQGLALGGEYGGAATFVAEHSPPESRGAHTAWIQTTATLGLLLSLMVILGTRTALGEEAFAAWGWRIPFLVSVLLLGASVWIRMSMEESPVFRQMKAEGRGSRKPLREAFGQWSNLKVVLIALFGLTAGQAVVWYTGQFYALFFLTQLLKIDSAQANLLIGLALILGTPFFIVFGALSDRIGRKPIILAGCLLAALTYFPLFKALTTAGNPALAQALRSAPVTLHADPSECSFQFNPTNTAKFTSSCDVAKQALANASVNYQEVATMEAAYIQVGERRIDAFDARVLSGAALAQRESGFKAGLAAALDSAGYPAKADPGRINRPLVIAILWVLVIYVTMVYGPIAAMLVEMFPTRIRYSAMSLPYHIGNGWFGGLLPTTAFAIVAQTGNIYSGLWYPVIVASATVLLGGLLVKETRGRPLQD